MKYFFSLFMTPYTGIVLLVLASVMVLEATSPTELKAYSHEDYKADVDWCIDHGWEMTSSGIDNPVTCLKDGQQIAVPPNSINARRK